MKSRANDFKKYGVKFHHYIIYTKKYKGREYYSDSCRPTTRQHSLPASNLEVEHPAGYQDMSVFIYSFIYFSKRQYKTYIGPVLLCGCETWFTTS